MTRDGQCRGITLARQAAAREAPPAFAAMGVRLALGPFSQPLPEALEPAARLVHALLDMAMRHDAAALDRPPRVETAFGEMPVPLLARCRLLEGLAAHPDGRDGADGRLLRSAAALHAHLGLVDVLWRERLYGIWKALRKAEAIAADLVSSHLTRNLAVAREARARYLHPYRKMWLPKLSSAEYRDLARSVERMLASRSREGLAALRTDMAVRSALTLACTVASVWAAWSRGALLLDREAWDAIAAAEKGLAGKAGALAEAAYRHLEVLRAEAERHPILLVIQHATLDSVLDVGAAVGEASLEAEKAIAHIRAEGVNRETVPSSRRPQDVSCSGLADRLAASPLVGVWKLPFFMERALLHLSPAEAQDVRGILELAAKRKDGEAIAQSLALFGIEAAMMAAPAAGPVGLALSFLWSLGHLGESLREYHALAALYRATLDPALLLRESEHGVPSKSGILLDLLGLLAWRR